MMEQQQGQHEQKQKDSTTAAQEEEEEERIQTVVFLRHGVAQHNYSGANLTSPALFDPPLVHPGKVGALEAGQKIQMWFLSIKNVKRVDLVIASPLTRCLQTAVLAFGIPGDVYYPGGGGGGDAGGDNKNTNSSSNNNDRLPQKQADEVHSKETQSLYQQHHPPTISRNDDKSSTSTSSSSSSSSTNVVPIVCVEQVREAFGMHFPDKRRTLTQLKSHWGHFVRFDTHMTEEDVLWSSHSRESYVHLDQRISQFLHFLCQRPETFIVVVSHGVWMETLFQRHDPQALRNGSHDPTAGAAVHDESSGGSSRRGYRRVYNCNAFASQCVSSRKNGGSFLRLQNTHLL